MASIDKINRTIGNAERLHADLVTKGLKKLEDGSCKFPEGDKIDCISFLLTALKNRIDRFGDYTSEASLDLYFQLLKAVGPGNYNLTLDPNFRGGIGGHDDSGSNAYIPNLQQVTTEGNSTNKGITFIDTLSSRSLIIDGRRMTFNDGDFSLVLDILGLTEDQLIQLPDESGTLVLSVNGHMADESGNVEIDIEKNLQQITDVGNRTDNDIILDKSKLTFENLLGNVDLEANSGKLYQNDKRLLDEDDIKPDPDLTPYATNAAMQAADTVHTNNISNIVDVYLPQKLDKDASQQANRILFIDPTTLKAVGQANFTFDKLTGQIKVNTTAVNNNYRALIAGGVSILSGVLNMDEYQSIINVSGGRCALIADGNGIHYRLFNNDETNFPDTSKSFVWRNKGFVHFRCYTTPLALNGSGQPTVWRQINSFEQINRFPHIESQLTSSYKAAVIDNTSKEIRTVDIGLGTMSPEFIASLPIINDGVLTSLAAYAPYRTTDGAYGTIRYKMPTASGKFNSKFNSKFA